MVDNRVKISSIVENQLPEFVRVEFPLVGEFLSQYYLSLEGQGSTLDILQNIDKYVKVDNLVNITDSTSLSSNVDFLDTTISVQSTYGFPKSYGLIQIDSEIITYTGITTNSFTGCLRGFSGITSYRGYDTPDELVFSQSGIATHSSGATVNNLSVIFLKEFFNKVKTQVTPGFEDRQLYSGLDQRIFIKQSKDFYSSKGTDQSFEILFRALYGEDVEVIKPRDYLFIPSDAQYRVVRNLVVEGIDGNPEDLLNRTLFQDKTDNFPAANGSVADVQKITRNGKNYYVLSLDYDFNKDISVEGSIFGKFSIHPQTKLVTSVSTGATTLDVDSTVGFPTTGTLIANYSDGTSSTIKYQSKTLNQFFGCSGVDRNINLKQDLRLDAYAYGYSGLSTDTSNVIKVRVTGVLSGLDDLSNSYYYDTGDIIETKYPGIGLTDYQANNWFFNVSTLYNVKTITLQNSSIFTYNVTTYDKNNFNLGDIAKIISSDGVERSCKIVSILNENTFTIQDQGQLDTSFSYTIRKSLSKVNSNNYPELNIYTTNVQNVYTDKKSLFVTSPSIPSYLDQPLNINNRSVTLNGSFSGEQIVIPDHGFYTGDSVTYKSISTTNTLGISDGIYFIKKVDDDTIKLSRSKANIFNEIYVSVSGTVTNNTLEYTSFAQQKLQSQKIIRKLTSPETTDDNIETVPGLIGVLVNGVEILNYKSNDSVFYGPIQTVDVTSSGDGYDVINPPILEITDSIGTGASCHCEVEGNLKRIEVVDSGFDFIGEPQIVISGGNGSEAIAKPNMVSIDHSVSFNATVNAGLVNLTNNTVAFSSYHKFRDGEFVIYKTDGQAPVGGLSTNSSYYISVEDAYTVKFHSNYSDATSKINSIDLTSYGVGNHTLECLNKKFILGSVSIVNSGSGYRNKKTVALSSGINTSANTINIKNHGYQSGEVIYYSPESTPISGLSTGSYYLTKVDDDNFKLSSIGIGTTNQDFFYKTNQFIDLKTTGTGKHIFNYPEIRVTVSGLIGVSTFTNQNFNAVLQPIFRGQVKSVSIESGGIGYGASEILNYNRQPSFSLNSGSGAQLQPIVLDGKIQNIIVLNGGTDYNSPPNIDVYGSGQGAIVSPVISNGSITSVKVVSGGVGYTTSNTTVTVTAAGSGAKFNSTPKKWTVNIFERLLQNNQIVDDDGVITKGTNTSFGLQYSHLYSPRKLRQSVYGTKVVNGNLTYIPDLQIRNNKEILSDTHSPIIGWAYDGNPIYGPYGYISLTGGSVKVMESGYEEIVSADRPNPTTSNGNSLYPSGFFVEDYSYQNTGDLDEYNGRFCVTPEFPYGTYAYFTTINPTTIESGSQFVNYRKPVFPYFIGNKFKSKPIDYNFDRYSNQDDVDLSKTNLIRNTTPYNFAERNTSYDFVIDVNKIQKQNTEITSIELGNISSVGIETGGSNYKVNDLITFDNENTGGSGAKAKVSRIVGKTINQISIATSTIQGVEFYPYNNTFLGFATAPHNFSNNDLVTITISNDYEKTSNIGIKTNSLSLSVGVGSTPVTGIVTYFNVSGPLSYPDIRENDIYEIGVEQIKVLNIDLQSSRIRVLRNQNNTIGLVSYSAGSILTEKSRKLTSNFNIDEDYNFTLQKEIYFNPAESVGLGTTSGVGITSTINFSNPGAGLTQITIPTRSIYIKDHNLNSGDALIYSNNGGTSVSISTDGLSSFQLTNNSVVYATRFTNDLIGISTFKVGLGSTGVYVGLGTTSASLLYFTSTGNGVVHSFKTNYTNSLISEISKNIVTVSTASTHGLSYLDQIALTVKPGISTTVVVKYNDYNRRLLINPRSFTSIDTINNSITLSNHGYYNGQKVLYTSNTPATGLSNESIYYVVIVDSNTIKLSNTYYATTLQIPDVVNITSSTAGTISPINPPINIERNKTITFDLSDSSLSFTNNSVVYSAFDFNIYSDPDCRFPFYSSSSKTTFEVVKTGTIGISANASLTLTVTDNIPKNLYYTLDPINLSINNDIKKGIILDSENINSNNTLTVVDNVLSGKHTLTGIGSTLFTFNIKNRPDKSNYTLSDGKFEYTTNSLSAFGEISLIDVTSPGRSYKVLPGISSIYSLYGTGAILLSQSNNIGKILKTEIQDIGFDYPVDTTLRPEAKLPQILKVEPFSTFNKIGITSVGVNYLVAPDLVVLDGFTNSQVLDVDLDYELGDSEVSILKNTKGLNDKTPIIIPINNSNGIPVSSISFNGTTKNVTVSLGVSFSSTNDFPFEIGNRVLIEGISVGIASTAKGYNSSKYNYSLFTLTQVDPNIGGANASITYNLSEYLSSGEIPGSFDSLNSSGRVIPSKYFPIFDVSLSKNEFFEGETVISNSGSGVVNSWENKNGYLKVSTIDEFVSGEIIKGLSSNSQGTITSVISFPSQYKVDSSSIVKNGWNRETGFLNNDLQRLHDSDYYQYFSYSIKSKVGYENWNDAVSSLNHTAGFKKFSDLIVESQDTNNVGIATTQNFGDFTGIADLIRTVDLNCVNDFDLATENVINIDSQEYSDEIVFKSAILQDYIESVGNRVLVIDDISGQFNSNPRPTAFSAVDSFDLRSARSRKYITYVSDKRFTSERQILLVSLTHNYVYGFINQYARNETVDDLGRFDFNIFGTEGQLLFFYPTKSAFNNYNINLVAYSIEDTISGVGQTSLGDTVKIFSDTQTLATGTTSETTIVGIASTYRSSKILVSIAATDNSYSEFNELTVIHDGSNVSLLEYGQLITTNPSTSFASTGLGTYNAVLSGSNLDIKFTPNAGLAATHYVNSLVVSIANTSSTGVSTIQLSNTSLDSRITSIASSTAPTASTIAEYNIAEDFSCAYYIVSIEDKTNSRYQVSEIVLIDDGTTASIVEYGTVQTSSGLGTFDANVSTTTQLLFTPVANINAEVRVFQNALKLDDASNPNVSLDFNNASIISSYGSYSGTDIDVKRSFNLLHNQLPIFRRDFIGSASTVVNINSNVIEIPNHYFVTGEELTYSYPGSGTAQAIGIATTTITGIGLTNKLPTTVYAVKVDDVSIKLSDSVENALKNPPSTLSLTSVGIGTSHALTCKKQNSRVLIGIDNVIQSPIVSTAITTTLVKNITISETTVAVSGVTSFFGGDLIKINDEIMRVDSVGFGSTNVFLVKREWMGTGITTHANGALVTKVNGNYNIVNNTINFVTAPYGPTPIGTTAGSPDEVDYIGITTYSTFSGRSFMRSGVPNTSQGPYDTNYIFDDISSKFTGYTTSFTLTSSGSSVSGISTDNSILLINEIFQQPQRLGSVSVIGDYTIKENNGISTIQFTGSISSTSYDVNTASIPRGGVIVSVASTEGFGYQPLISAGGTAIVSGLGTITSISIGNSGSGYRSGIQTTVNVGVATSSTGIPNIEFIGTASISNGRIVSVAITNPGSGYTSTNPPVVIFDDPLPYSEIPLIYSSSSPSGIGSNAVANIVVGQGSSVIDFEIINLGYGYGQGQILTVAIGGTAGIPTDTSLSFKEFKITIDETYSDSFSGWSLGNLHVIDPIDSLFDGKRVVFPIKVNGVQKTIRSKPGSLIDVQASLLVFVNNILQVPGEGYLFEGGSYITLTEPPKEGDTSKIIYYQGTSSVDVVDVDILETIKVGDDVRLNDDDFVYKENTRVVTTINSTDSINTNLYAGPGISKTTFAETYTRPVIWCKQTEDRIINGSAVSKDRTLYEPLIFPTTNIIQTVGVGSTVIFVESVKTFFDSSKENLSTNNKIIIISQDSVIGASATAIVSAAGTISSIAISNGGIGYTFAPTVIVANPVGLGTTQRATATSSITSGIVTSIIINSPGTGYTTTNPPLVLIEEPNSPNEVISSVSYSGDFGVISGVSTTSVGVASTGIIFDLVIPSDSFLRDSSIVGSAITVSGIQTGYYFVVYNSNVGNGVTSIKQNGSTVGVGTSFLDNVYEVAAVSIAQTHAIGIGLTYVAKVTVSVKNYNSLTGLGYSNFFGQYSWGRISTPVRINPIEFVSYTNGLVGISTSPIVDRYNPLKYLNYN